VVTVTATPDAGWSFGSWSGELSGTTNPETITMDGDKSITATFTESGQDEHTFQSFVISHMTIDWAKDVGKPDNKWGWRSFFGWFTKFTSKNDDKFSISGRLKLPEGYTVENLKESATVSISISQSSGSDTVNFKEQLLRRLGVMWAYNGNAKPHGEDMKITKLTIWWAPQSDEWTDWAGFNIEGEIGLPESIGVNTRPAEATVTLEIPISADSGHGSLQGEETIKFSVSSRLSQWFYHRLGLPHFRFES
jgi:hypothetical protein